MSFCWAAARRAAGFLVLVLFARSARADPPAPPPLAVNMYDVATGCPDAAAFRAEIDRHTHGVTAPIQAKVYIAPGFEGTLDVVDASGARSTRNVKSARCEEIVSAFALVVALAVDDAATSPPPEAQPIEQPLAAAPEIVPVVAPSSFTAAPRVEVRVDHLVFRAGSDGAVEFGATPDAVVGLPIFVEIAREGVHPGFHVEPGARLAWTFGASDDASIAAGNATFHWTAGALDLCPVRLGFTTIADVRACARLELGVLSGAGSAETGGPTPKSDHRLWIAAGVPLTFRIEPAPFLFLELEGALRAPLVRDSFRVGASESLVFHPSVIGGDLALGAGFNFR